MARYRGSARWAANKFGKAVAREMYKGNRNKKPSSNTGCATLLLFIVLVAVIPIIIFRM